MVGGNAFSYNYERQSGLIVFVIIVTFLVCDSRH